MSDTTPETPSPAPAPSLEWTLRPRADKDGWTLLLNGLIKAGGSWQHCLNALDAALRQATQQPAVTAEAEKADPECRYSPTGKHIVARSHCQYCEERIAAPDAAAQAGTAEKPSVLADFVQALAEARAEVESIVYWKRFIDGTPLSNDMPVKIAQAYCRGITAAQARIAELERERDRMRSINTRMLVRGLRAEGSENCPFCEQYQPTGHAQESPQCAMCFLEEKYDTARASLAAVEKERDALRAWKDSAMSLTPPLQEIGRELAMPLGASVPERILPGIKSLKAALAAAQERVKALAETWRTEARLLDSGNHPGRQGLPRRQVMQESAALFGCVADLERLHESTAARAQSSEEGRP